MACGACRCYCNAGREAQIPGDELPGASADLENGRRTQKTTATVDEDPVNEIAMSAVNRVTKFVVRGLLILLWVYLYNSMRRYAISYIGNDTWFSTFVVTVIAVPVAEFFCILGQVLCTPPPRSFDLWPRPFPQRK
ncbi:hypothetical protein PVAP13_8KG094300 [Panicum virgatum]|uniref:Uncharacterized protein n=1 Tax=Panicum virgatum TaxID=38727 RepID=A0A8T0PFN0_PANVG|nr:hypothetical protein PVAP13_8KG094300 [Panicum virgatum]